MKKGIHPENYRLVAFKDMSNDVVFLCRSAVSTKETIEVNGETYPVYKMEISNTSHPFRTATIFPGVLPSISLASSPIAMICSVSLS